jgi:hypothetical protein
LPQDQDFDVELRDPLVASRLIELTVASLPKGTVFHTETDIVISHED